MTPIFRALIASSLIFTASLRASSPLATQSEIDSAFTTASSIFRGTVIATKSQWLCGDKEITEKEAFEIEAAYLKHSEESITRFGIDSDEPAALAFEAAWQKSKMGLLFDQKITAIRIATIRCDAPTKGDFPERGVISTVAWYTGILQTCSHVVVPTKVGSKVLVFLFKGWRDSQPIISERNFLLGRIDLKPSTSTPSTQK